MLFPAPPRSGLRRGLVALAAAAVVLALPAHADDLQDAAKLLKGGQHSQALERVNKALSSKPRDPQARFLKGLILTEQGNTREAIDIFSKLTQDFPELPEPYNNLAVIYASQGQYEKARTALEQSIRTHPSYATAYENLGDVYAKLASQAYDKALQIDSSNAGAQNKLSLVRGLVGGPAAAAKPPVVVAQKPPEKAAEKAAEKQPAAKPAEKPAEKLAEKPAAQKPVAEKAPAQKPADNAGGEGVAAGKGWGQAWSKKEADGYLSYYAQEFKNPGDESRAAWGEAPRSPITAPPTISPSISAPKVTLSGADRATVTFRQTYRSDVLKSSNTKTLVMVKNEGRWQIQQERSGG